MAYPVSYEVERPESYNRLTVAFRLILAIPQLFLVGGLGFVAAGGSNSYRDDAALQSVLSIINTGVLTLVAGILVFIAWFAILFTGRFPAGFRDFVAMVFRWAMNVHAYVMLQADPYPPFSGNAPYVLRTQVSSPERHNRLTVLFRIFLAIPHFIVLVFLQLAQLFVTIWAWFAILFTGRYPEGLYGFSVGVSRWYARANAYSYLLVDEYPPFSLASDPAAAGTQPRLA